MVVTPKNKRKTKMTDNNGTQKIVTEGQDYAEDGFSIHTEERINGWGFRMRSDKYFMIYCLGGFVTEQDALVHCVQYIAFVQTTAGGVVRIKGGTLTGPKALPVVDTHIGAGVVKQRRAKGSKKAR
jgi:hypothetical protein